MNQYFVVIAYSNNVYFCNFWGPFRGRPQKFFQARSVALARHIFRPPPLPYL